MIFRDDLRWILHEELQDSILCLRQTDNLFSGGDLAAIQIQRQLTVLQDCRSDGIPTIPQLNSDAGQQFFGVKGFGDIIGGAAQQKIHLVLGVHLGADNDCLLYTSTFGEIYSELFKMIETGKTGEVYRHIGVRDLEEQKS